MKYKEIIKLAQEKGFEYEDFSQPLFEEFEFELEETKLFVLVLIQKWLREQHRIFLTINFSGYLPDKPSFLANVKSLSSKNMCERLLEGFTLYTKYEKALKEGIFESLKLI